MFDSQAINQEQTAKLVGALRGGKRDAFLASVLYHCGGEVETTEGLMRLIEAGGIGPWSLNCYVNKKTRAIVLRLENAKGDRIYASHIGSGGRGGAAPTDTGGPHGGHSEP